MDHRVLDQGTRAEIATLFRHVFTASEGEKEGELIGHLAAELAAGIDDVDIIGYGTYVEESLVGCLFFTRLRLEDPISIYMLAPMAVETRHQGKGIGKALINFALHDLRRRSVCVAVTYGDPSFYSKTGFSSLSEEVIQAPCKLSLPEGWLGQSLRGGEIPTIRQRPACVKEFDNPAYW
jgi:predicted N-acetyltransferase YhbS